MASITIWTRLEPRCRTDDMNVGLEARTHDPFWMLARQWQMGELQGDDAGSPIVATIDTVEMPLDRFAAPGLGVQRVPRSAPLESLIERERVRPAGTAIDYRQSAEAGLQFLRLLQAGNLAQYAAAYVTAYAIAQPAAAALATLDIAALRLAGVVARRAPDGVRLAADLRAALPALPATPAVAATDAAGMLGVVHAFLAWYDSLFDEPGPTPASAGATGPWSNERMEYQFTLDSSTSDTPGALTATRYTGEPLDWTSFDQTATSLGPVTAAPPSQRQRRVLIPSPVGFKGMPARRFWQLEDAAVDLGALEAGPADLGRLMLREFALVYGNDWFVIPLSVQVGTACRITSLVVTDTFGVAQTVPHYSATPDGGRWRMFAVTGDTAPHRLVMPPVLAKGIDSEPLEQVLLVRDEPANMAWGIERIVQGASGAPIDRASAAAAPPAAPGPLAPALRYRLGTSVPSYYIPFIPVSIDAVQRRMQRAAFLRTDGTPGIVSPLGRLLNANVPLFEEEFAREGARVERRYRMARWTDGSTHLWVARRKAVGVNVGSSGLQFDRIE
jgi:hypothetical protein